MLRMRKKPDKIVLLGIAKLDAIEVLISKALIDVSIGHDEFVSVYNEVKQEIKNPQKAVKYTI